MDRRFSSVTRVVHVTNSGTIQKPLPPILVSMETPTVTSLLYQVQNSEAINSEQLMSTFYEEENQTAAYCFCRKVLSAHLVAVCLLKLRANGSSVFALWP